MKKHIFILIVLDSVGALTSGDLSGNAYLVDNNKRVGSFGEGQSELVTACSNNQFLEWRISTVDPYQEAQIVGFSGQIVDNNICTPRKTGLDEDTYWAGVVQTQGDTGEFQYTIEISMNNQIMTISPFINVIS
ncbi:alpha-pore-forming tripartite toxin MakABE regulator [Anaeromicropila populeti]|uniref:Uncharacterized protein n=1 Tax=Anaeromicropila populeti TaxID=37658 RepID=A0A1I6JVT9_9FIRM|nr:hypothetical protein [Anaeromicropila populeti]SFR83092.1 hypothetical protein SAMN05661086_01993 [Anaeromicropila populeti]